MAVIENWGRIEVGVLDKHIKKLTRPGIRDHIHLAMMQKRGRIRTNVDGKSTKWPVRFRRHLPTTDDDMQPNVFVRINRDKIAELPWRAYIFGELVSQYEKDVCKGESDWFGVIEKLVGKMTDDFNDYIHLEIYNNGNASGNSGWHGLGSIFREADSAIGASYTPCLAPSSATYGGLNMELGNYGGAWTPSTGFPVGTGPLEYHFFSPMIIDYESTYLKAATKTWVNTWQECIRFAQTYQNSLHSSKFDIFLMTDEMLRDVSDSLTPNQRVQITGKSEVADLGFDEIRFEGTHLVSEYGCTSGNCYGLNFNKMEYRSLQKQMLQSKQQFDIDYNADKISLRAAGNLRYESPCFQCLLTS